MMGGLSKGGEEGLAKGCSVDIMRQIVLRVDGCFMGLGVEGRVVKMVKIRMF